MNGSKGRVIQLRIKNLIKLCKSPVTRVITLCLGATISLGAMIGAHKVSADPGLSDIVLEGPLTQGTLLKGMAPKGAKITHKGREVRVADDGLFVLGFGRDADLNQTFTVHFADGKKHEQSIQLKKRQYKIQRIEGVPKAKVNPSKKSLERIKKETALVKKARKLDDVRTDFRNGFEWPLIGRITGVYGSQRFYNGEPRRPHFGIDVAAPVGTEVSSPAPGVVTMAHPDMFYSGGTLIIDHGHGVSSAFLHLSKILVKVGDHVKLGDPIAQVGAGGRSTGAHLDWRINWFDQRVDPQLVVAPMKK